MSSKAVGRISLGRIHFTGFRNLNDAVFEPHPETNLLHGGNGHGKTSILEAIYALATTRSFRTSKLRDIVAHGQSTFTLAGDFHEEREGLPSFARRQTAAYVDKTIAVRVDGNKPRTAASYAVLSPIVVFHPDELLLSTGPAELRRRLLDRVALYRFAGHAKRVADYARAVRSRQELLRGGHGSPAEIEAYEGVIADASEVIIAQRRAASETLFPRVANAFEAIADKELRLVLTYAASGVSTKDALMEQLASSRRADAKMPSPARGAHRDDVAIHLGGHAARKVASQGQHRAIALALKAGESSAVAEITSLEPIQLLDDVSSELDAERTSALFRYLAELRGQVFVTTARRDLLDPLMLRHNVQSFHVRNGSVERS